MGSIDANLADIGNVSVSGKMSTVGFGSIDKLQIKEAGRT